MKLAFLDAMAVRAVELSSKGTPRPSPWPTGWPASAGPAIRPSRSAVARLCVPYRSITVTEPLHNITCAAPAQPVQRATSWWACL